MLIEDLKREAEFIRSQIEKATEQHTKSLQEVENCRVFLLKAQGALEVIEPLLKKNTPSEASEIFGSEVEVVGIVDADSVNKVKED